MRNNIDTYIPPLLPLEYCKLDRACKMLGCEINDLLHWGEILAIDILFRTEKIRLNKYLIHPEGEISEEEKNENEEIGIDFVVDCITKYTWIYQYHHDEYIDVEGLWPIDLESIRRLNMNGYILKEDIKIAAVDKGHFVDNDKAIFFNLKDSIDANELKAELRIDDFYIAFDDIKKIHNSIISGEQLVNLYNFHERLESPLHMQPQVDKVKITSKQSNMIMALIKLHPELSKHIDNASRLLAEFEKMCARIGIQCPVQDPKTIRDWLIRAGG